MSLDSISNVQPSLALNPSASSISLVKRLIGGGKISYHV